MSYGEATESKPQGRFGLLFIVALILAATTYGLEFSFSLLFPLVVNGMVDIQLYNLIQNLALFILNPVICFVVFFTIGKAILVGEISDKLRVLYASFLGGLVGYGIAFLGLIIYDWAKNGDFLIGSPTDLISWSGVLVIALVRAGISMALIAFVGVMLGSSRQAAALKEPQTESANPGTPVSN